MMPARSSRSMVDHCEAPLHRLLLQRCVLMRAPARTACVEMESAEALFDDRWIRLIKRSSRPITNRRRMR